MAVEPVGQKTVEFSDLIRRAAAESFSGLRELVDQARSGPDRSDSQRKIELLKYIFRTRQRMLRLHVLAKWCQQVPLVQYCQQLAGILSSHDTSFTQAADLLFFTHEGLQQARAPVYDVPSAIEVLLSGSYRRLPKCIEDLGVQTTIPEDEIKPVLKNLDTLLRSRLLEVDLPKEISEITISDGTVLLRVEGEFKVILTLGYRGHLSLWRILHLELLIAEKNGSSMKLEELRRYALGDDLERRMAAADKPFAILYAVLHDLCVSLVMDTVVKQVQLLRQGRWKDAIRFELISDGQDGESDSAYQRTPGVKISYWVELEKMLGGIDSDLLPFIKIEVGPHFQIICVHSGFVIDPVTEKEAEFVLDQSCIDVEGLLLRATACSTHTRLVEIQRDIIKIPQIFQADGDIVLKCKVDGVGKGSQMECIEDEVLCVRVYGSLFITLGVSIRSGRLVLLSSRNIIVSSALFDAEEALNQGTKSAGEVFVGLKCKIIIHLFGFIGKFLGLKVYERDLITLKIPRSISGDSSDLVLMEFPQCGSCYYLLLNLDRDLRPLFKLLETQPPLDGSDGWKNVIRFCSLDLNWLSGVEDGLNLSPFNWGRMDVSLPAFEDSKKNLSSESVNSPSNFSAVVDQLFEIEKRGAVQRHLPHKTAAQGAVSSVISPKQEETQYSTNNLKGFVQTGAISSLKQAPMNSSTSLNSFQDHSLLLTNFRSVSELYGPLKGNSLHSIGSQLSNVSQGDERLPKRSFADITKLVSSNEALDGSRKKRKLENSSNVNSSLSSENLFVSTLLLVMRHCALCIKHGQITSQMDALEIPYVEEVSRQSPSSNLWFRLPFCGDECLEYMRLSLGKLGTMSWYVEVNDLYFKELWELQKGSSSSGWGGVRLANVSYNDSHICLAPEGVVLNFDIVEVDSISKLISDLRRLSNARSFARGMRALLGVKSCDEKLEESSEGKQQLGDKLLEQTKRDFTIEAVGLMGLHFYYAAMPVLAHFVVEWEAEKEGCTMHVFPDQLWPHTKFLEDFINGGEVALFLDCIRLTAGPLFALANAIRPTRMTGPVASPNPIIKQLTSLNQASPFSSSLPPSHTLHNLTQASSSVPGRGGPSIVPSSLLPFDVAVLLRGPYHIRIFYRKKFALDMRCFAGDQVWLQPATPPKGGISAGGSLPCPQFRTFITENVAQGMNALESGFPNSSPPLIANGSRIGGTQVMGAVQRAGQVQGTGGNLGRAGGSALVSSAAVGPTLPLRVSPIQLRGELNTAFLGLGDDGGYGGGWVPLSVLKKVLRGILKYLGVLWLFSQLPELLKKILGSVFKENEGGVLNLDQEQPALRFFVGGYVFCVTVHRVQLFLQIIPIKRVHHNQTQQQHHPVQPQEELTTSEIAEICEYFSRRVASEPYDISRVSSFVTLLTLPISVLREFLKLIAWEKGFFQSGEPTPSQRARVELSLENHSAIEKPKSDIDHDRARSIVDFGLTFVLDPALVPHTNAAGGATWLPHCVSVRLRYAFGGDTWLVSLMGMEGSHGGRACWVRLEDWEKCKLRVARAVEFANSNVSGDNQGKLRSVAESLHKSLQLLLQQLREGAQVSGSAAVS